MNNRFLVLDAPVGLHGDLLTRWFDVFRQRDPITRAYGAIYYPWLRRGDESFPACGAVMGMYARVELSHGPIGVGWPPANVPVHGATHTEVEMDWAEAGSVGDAGINPLIVQPGAGVVVWGARTMSTDTQWVHINSRRIVSMVTEQLRRDTEWAVFEPNDSDLWKVIERDVRVRLDQFWTAGILSGTRAAEEYSVECSRATNPPAVRDRGELHVRVHITPVGTTERILVDLRLGSSGP
jgi:phage tail sheath protein FI